MSARAEVTAHAVVHVFHRNANAACAFGMQNVLARFLGHAHAVIGNPDNHIVVAIGTRANSHCELTFGGHSMLHRVFNQRLNQERRNHQVFYLGFNIQLNTHAIFAETRHLEREVTHSLLNLTRQRNQIGRIIQRAAVEHRKLTQQNARLVGIGAHKRCDSINSVEQKMRVDLALQSFQLHAGCKLLLTFQRLCCKLCGNKLGKAFRNGLLRGRNLAR